MTDEEIKDEAAMPAEVDEEKEEGAEEPATDGTAEPEEGL